jgi:hypothetical protein
MNKLKIDHILVLIAFIATLVVYAVLSLNGNSVNTLADILLALVGALAGISMPRSGSGGE